MQKNSKLASILLWSIFISMILSLFFLSISTKITKNLKNNSNIIEKNEFNYIINNQIKNFNFEIIKLKNWEYLVFENLNPLIRTLKQNQEKYILFNSWSEINLKIEKIYWSDLYYELYKWSSKNNINTLIWSWILNNNLEIKILDSSNNWWKILLKNLWWESKVRIYSQKSAIPKYINYKIIKITWNNQIIKYKNIKKLW